MNFKTNYMITLRKDALVTLLRREFMKDLRAYKMCASDTTHWILKDKEQTEESDTYIDGWMYTQH